MECKEGNGINRIQTLQRLLKEKGKSSHVSSDKITFNYAKISNIGRIKSEIHRMIKKLHLSNNHLSSLQGIEDFPLLENISLAHNRLSEWQELLAIRSPEKVLALRLIGNPMELNPNYRKHVLEIFGNLRKLDGITLTDDYKKKLVKFTDLISRNIIPFLFCLNREKDTFENVLDKLRIKKELNFSKKSNILESIKLGCLEKIKKIVIKHNNFAKGKKLSAEQHLHFIQEFVCDRYGLFENKQINEREQFNQIYRHLFNDILVKFAGKFDRNLELFLFKKLKENKIIDKSKLKKDKYYAKECMMLEFYKLMPCQAKIYDLEAYDQAPNELTSPKNYITSKLLNDNKSILYSSKQSPLSCDSLSHRLFVLNHGKELYLYKRYEPTNDLEIDYNNPECLNNFVLSHFPVFPLNEVFMESLYEVILDKFFYMSNLLGEVLKFDDKAEHFKELDPSNNKGLSLTETRKRSPIEGNALKINNLGPRKIEGEYTKLPKRSISLTNTVPSKSPSKIQTSEKNRDLKNSPSKNGVNTNKDEQKLFSFRDELTSGDKIVKPKVNQANFLKGLSLLGAFISGRILRKSFTNLKRNYLGRVKNEIQEYFLLKRIFALFKKTLKQERSKVKRFFEINLKQKAFFAFMAYIIRRKKAAGRLLKFLMYERKATLQRAIKTWKINSFVFAAFKEAKQIENKKSYNYLNSTKVKKSDFNNRSLDFNETMDLATMTFREHTYLKLNNAKTPKAFINIINGGSGGETAKYTKITPRKPVEAKKLNLSLQEKLNLDAKTERPPVKGGYSCIHNKYMRNCPSCAFNMIEKIF